MAAYKDLVGQKITKVTSNPGEPKTGQMWYNSANGKLRGLAVLQAWSSASPLTNARETQGFGSQTSGLVAGGSGPFGPPFTAVELYDGTGWSTGTSLPADRNQVGPAVSSPQTAGLIFAGNSPPGSATNTSLEWDGSSWTSGGNYPGSLARMAGAGTQTAALGAGGKSPHSNVAATYDGSSWTAISNIGTARYGLGGAGASSTSAVIFGGSDQSYPSWNPVNNTEEWDGSSWSEQNNLSTARSYISGCGTQTTALVGAGITNPASTLSGAIAEAYDGTSWTSAPNPAQARHTYGIAGNSSNAFMAGGATPTKVSSTEELTTSTNIITAGAWASGGALNQARFQMAGCGTLTAGLAFGGYGPVETGKTEEYDGTSFSEQNDMGTARYEMGNGSGTQTAALCSAGRTDTAHGGGAQAFVEEYDGTSWSEVNNLPGNRTAHGSAGPQTASIIALGKSAPPAPSVVDTSLHYDGTNWTSGGTANTARFAAFGAGTQTSAIFAGGNPSLATAEEYNGSAWTTTGSLLAGAQGPSAAGADSDAALFTSGGNGGTSSGVAQTSSYNGTVFVSAPQLASERGYAAGFGIQTSAVVAGGLRSSGVTTTEEFTAETETANIKDFTTS